MALAVLTPIGVTVCIDKDTKSLFTADLFFQFVNVFLSP